MNDRAALIGVNWGTSSFRALLIAESGAILDRKAAPQGILTAAESGFASVLHAGIDGWRAQVPVLLSGMVGSRQGWIEVPYVETPATLGTIARGLVPAGPAEPGIFVIPGVARMAGAAPEVMRGEEVQAFGALGTLGRRSGLLAMPGTHSKWVSVEDGSIAGIDTYMTGELFAACRDHTILGRLMEGAGEDDDAFAKGVAEGAREGSAGALLRRLFSVRTSGLFARIPAAGLSDYLSGMLIGAEIADRPADGTPVSLIATAALTARYARAAELLGRTAEIVDPDCIAAGYLAIARAAGLLGDAG